MHYRLFLVKSLSFKAVSISVQKLKQINWPQKKDSWGEGKGF